MLQAAVKLCEAYMLKVTSADVQSHVPGGSERKIKAVFDVAIKLSQHGRCCIVFGTLASQDSLAASCFKKECNVEPACSQQTFLAPLLAASMLHLMLIAISLLTLYNTSLC